MEEQFPLQPDPFKQLKKVVRQSEKYPKDP